MADWSELTNDVLQFIASKLELPDYHRFGAVCQNWQLAAKSKNYPPANQLPWLILGEDEKTRKHVFYSLSESKHYYIDIPELHGHICRGSSYGWLFTVDREIDGHLLNPLTRECFKLPPLPDYDERLNLEKIKTFQGKERYRLQCHFVMKAILSNNPRESEEFSLVIIFGSPRKVAFWRPCDPNWSVVVSPCGPIEDITFFKGRLYALAPFFALTVVDISPHPKMTLIGSIPLIQRGLMSKEAYLVDLAGKSLILIQRIEDEDEDEGEGEDGEYDDDTDGDDAYLEELARVWERHVTDVDAHRHFVTKELLVHEIDLEGGICYERCDIDGSAFFVGSGALVLNDTAQVPGCVPDRISYTGILQLLSGFSRTGFYDMVSKTVGEYNPSQLYIPHPISPTWFTPNPW